MVKILRYSAHAGIWLILYFLPYLLAFKGKPNIRTIFSNPGDTIHLISFIFLIIYSYVNYYLLLPSIYFKRNYILYILCLALCCFVVIKLPQFLAPEGRGMKHVHQPSGEPPPLLFGMTYNVILFLASTFLSISLQYRKHLFQIEKEKLNAEIAFLKAQINPHFLFNTLNSIYALVIEKSDDAPKAVIQLSELMRYIIRDSNADYVELSKELGYISNYIALQKERLGDTAEIGFSSPSSGNNFKIAPLLLMSFIENAFKYGVNPDKHSEISISISLEDAKLQLLVANMIVSSNAPHQAGGIGMKNAMARLEHLYPEKFNLSITNENDIFSVNLTIDLA